MEGLHWNSFIARKLSVLSFLLTQKHFAAIAETDDNTSKEEKLFRLRAPTLQTLGGLFMVLDYIYRDNLKFKDDYR